MYKRKLGCDCAMAMVYGIKDHEETMSSQQPASPSTSSSVARKNSVAGMAKQRECEFRVPVISRDVLSLSSLWSGGYFNGITDN